MKNKVKKVNTATIKQILGFVRGHDFAHAGETEGIERVFKSLPKQKEQLLLDVGCGLAGSASYIQEKGWGRVVGLDIDSATIDYAKDKYPEIEVHLSDAVDVAKIFNYHFDVIYMLGVFYVFPDQTRVLTELRKVAKSTTKLAIFDYTDLGGYESHRPAEKYDFCPNPIRLDKIETMLQAAGWKLDHIDNLDKEYEYWYEVFVKRIVAKKEKIIAQTDSAAYTYIYNLYYHVLDSLKNGYLGGATIYASSCGRNKAI